MIRWLLRALLALALLVAGLLAPVGYVETQCRPSGAPLAYAALLAPQHHRPQTRMLMTYPEWDIVHAYEDYAQVLRTGDPHDFAFWRSVAGFWRATCAVTQASGRYGAIDGATKQMVYVIGVSFTAEWLLKAAYEETLGRAFAALRGTGRAALDDLSAQQAADYARFLQQVPWYKWRFAEDARALGQGGHTSLRDHERRIALGLEYRAKAAYARLIEKAVAQVGPDAVRLRMVVRGLDRPPPQVTVIAPLGPGVEIETPRYRALTHLLEDMAMDGVDFIEIAGNDHILLTLLSDRPTLQGALFSAPRQGFGDHRHVLVVKVATLGALLRQMQAQGQRVEHIHDY